jgi:hypothetical protein
MNGVESRGIKLKLFGLIMDKVMFKGLHLDDNLGD